MSAPGKNDKLRAVLAKHGLSYDVFLAIQPNSYEHALARYNLDGLDKFYELCFAPGLTLADVVSQCPKWPKPHKLAGQPPGDSLVSKIRKFWKAEVALDRIREADAFVQRLEQQLGRLPKARTEPVTEMVLNLLGQEVLTSTFSGLPVTEQLAAVDRLLKKRQVDNAWAETELAKARWMRESAQIVLDALKDGRAAEIERGRGSQTEKLQALGRLMFGEEFDALTAAPTQPAGNAPGRAGGAGGGPTTPEGKSALAEPASRGKSHSQ